MKRSFWTHLLATSLLMSTTACASRMEHRVFSEDQVGLSALHEDEVRKVILSPEMQALVGKHQVFAETLNQEILKDPRGFTEAYNVYSSEPMSYPQTGSPELDSFFLRGHRAAASLRLGIRLFGFVSGQIERLQSPEASPAPGVSPEALMKFRQLRGRLSSEQKRQVVRHVIVLAAEASTIQAAIIEAKGLQVEGENLKTMLESASYEAELRQRDPGRAALLPEIRSNLNGTLAALRQLQEDGPSFCRDAQLWKLTLVDAL